MKGTRRARGLTLHRTDLSNEAIRLTREVHKLLPDNGEVAGLLALMLLTGIFHSPDVKTERSIRFILFNNEETGGGAAAYVRQRSPLQGVENPAGSGKYPEPKWLGMIQHDMMMWDHGMPGPDGKVSPEQRREADVNIEFAGASKFAAESAQLAWFFRQSNDKYATDYPAAVGDRMSNTDSNAFMEVCPAISLARTSVSRTRGRVGTRRGISRLMSSPRSATRIFGWA